MRSVNYSFQFSQNSWLQEAVGGVSSSLGDTASVGQRWLADGLTGTPGTKAEKDCVTFSRHCEKNLKSFE